MSEYSGLRLIFIIWWPDPVSVIMYFYFVSLVFNIMRSLCCVDMEIGQSNVMYDRDFSFYGVHPVAIFKTAFEFWYAKCMGMTFPIYLAIRNVIPINFLINKSSGF